MITLYGLPTTWYKPSEKLPPVGRYVLCRHNRGTWISKDKDGVNYVVLALVHNTDKYNIEHGCEYMFEEFGPDKFSLDEIDYWTEIPRMKV